MYVALTVRWSGSENPSVQATWDTPGFKEYHRRMQLFILLYIEGGSYINEDEDPWEFVVLYIPSMLSSSFCSSDAQPQIRETQKKR